MPSNGRTRLCGDQVIQIFKSKLDLPRKSSAELAKIYCVAEKTIRDIWTGRTWSRETWHLDISRTLELKKTSRPIGRRDTKPRKKRASGMHHDEMSSILTGLSSLSSSMLTRPSFSGTSPVRVRTDLTWQELDPCQREAKQGAARSVCKDSDMKRFAPTRSPRLILRARAAGINLIPASGTTRLSASLTQHSSTHR
jgi:hypothetical protein